MNLYVEHHEICPRRRTHCVRNPVKVIISYGRLVVLLEEHSADEAGGGVFVGNDAGDAGAVLKSAWSRSTELIEWRMVRRFFWCGRK